MSEEEYKAIETLKNRTGFRIDYKCKNCGSGGLTIIPPDMLYGEEIDIALNYIDKLQKENKDLELAYGLYKDTADKLQKENQELKEELDYYKQKEKQEFDERDYYEE